MAATLRWGILPVVGTVETYLSMPPLRFHLLGDNTCQCPGAFKNPFMIPKTAKLLKKSEQFIPSQQVIGISGLPETCLINDIRFVNDHTVGAQTTFECGDKRAVQIAKTDDEIVSLLP